MQISLPLTCQQKEGLKSLAKVEMGDQARRGCHQVTARVLRCAGQAGGSQTLALRCLLFRARPFRTLREQEASILEKHWKEASLALIRSGLCRWYSKGESEAGEESGRVQPVGT